MGKRKNYVKNKDSGMYHIKGKKYRQLKGSRREVFNSKAFKTSGNVEKNGLMKNKNGRIVSKKLRKQAMKDKRLQKSGYLTKKGEFGAFKNGLKVTKKKKKKSNKKKTQKRRRN
jgi:hypothetical protein